MKLVKTYWPIVLLIICLVFSLVSVGDADVRISMVVLTLIVFGFIFLLLWIILKKKNTQLEKANLENELSLLKSQIDPHFYFNTLNNLYGLASRKSDKTANAIMKLSEIMRYVIYKGKSSRVSLEEEIQYIENYIELQELRINKELDVSFEKNIEDINMTIAPLLLIIPVENAFKHGVDALLDYAFVNIKLYENDNNLFFEVRNNFEENEQSNNQGIGLRNLKKRLGLLYNNNFALNTSVENNIYNFQLKINVT